MCAVLTEATVIFLSGSMSFHGPERSASFQAEPEYSNLPFQNAPVYGNPSCHYCNMPLLCGQKVRAGGKPSDQSLSINPDLTFKFGLVAAPEVASSGRVAYPVRWHSISGMTRCSFTAAACCKYVTSTEFWKTEAPKWS
jgi:hypothetical protein